MKIIRQAQKVYVTEYDLNFYTHKDGGFGFPCDENGVVDVAKLHPYSLDSYNRCISGEIKTIRPPFIQKLTHSYMEYSVGLCSCGREVELRPEDGRGIDCDCGAIYNMLGNRLRPRNEWEERYDED